MQLLIRPATISDHRAAPVNSLSYLRIMLRVDDLEELFPRLKQHGAEVVGEVVQFADLCRICYIVVWKVC